ncbi:MAG: glycosyltransferase family 2 protein [Chloroflexota bacterium]
MRLLIGIPAYNVESTLAEVVGRVRQAAPTAQVLIVDDGSTDDTLATARACADVVLRHEVNRGSGATQKAIVRFFLESVEYGDDDCLIFIHGDGEMRAEELPLLSTPLADPSVDACLGSRDLRLARKHRFANVGLIRPRWKRAVDRTMAVALNLVYGLRLTTYCGGFRAVRKRALRGLDASALHDRHFFDIQFLTWAGKRLRYVEVPISNVDNGAVSNYSMVRAGASVVMHVLNGFKRRGRVVGDRMRPQ